AEGTFSLATQQQSAHTSLSTLVHLSDTSGWQLLLRGSQQGPGLIDEYPAGGDQALKGLGRIAVERHALEHLLASGEAVDESGFDELGPRLEMAVESHATHARLGRDVGNRGIRVLPDGS